jgi:hypothetical protein
VEQHHNVQPGDVLPVIYDPRDPAQMQVTTLSRAQSRRLLFAALNVVVGLLVCALPFKDRIKQWRSPAPSP